MLMAEIKKRFLTLVDAYKTDAQVLAIIKADMDTIGLYVNEIVMFEYSMPIWNALNVPNERIATADNKRREMHNKAIVAVTQLVEFADNANIKPIYEDSLEDRHQIAQACEKIVITFFAGRDKFKKQDIEHYEQLAHEPVRYY